MKHPYSFLSFCLLTVLFPLGLGAQITFTNQISLLNSPFHSGVAIGVTDVNGDGLDDIIRLGQGRILNIEYQQADGSFENFLFGSISNSSQWSLCAADVDNNGFIDVLAGGSYDGVKVVKADNLGTSYSQSLLPGPNMFIQGSNFFDINNDGWLDVFACHDDQESRIWANNGDGTFSQADEWIDMATVPVSDNSGNYGSVWCDFDNDGDTDLYIAKCRQGVNNPNDPRRINALFVNDGNNNFTEDAGTYGLKIGAQSWTADFGDVDNDGDFDCFITNHDVPSMLLINDGTGHFTDVTATSGLDIQGLPIQGVFRDFDNDGFIDILVSGTDQSLWKNNGDQTFTQVANPFSSNDMESYAIGDLNHDGFPDIYGGYAQIYTSPSNINDALWINEGNSNHFLSVRLVGTESNKSAIGARISIYGDWGVQIREVRAGESYGILNAFAHNFGLAGETMVDSLVVNWPSGAEDVYVNIPSDQFLTLIEGNCIAPEADIAADGPTVFCSGESVDLTAPAGFNYLWSTGEETQTITVTDAGTYSVTISDNTGCFGISLPVSITVDPVDIPTISALGDTTFCLGGTVEITASDAAAWNWSNGETTQTITVSESGAYSVTTAGLCDDYTSSTIQVEVYEVEAPVAENDTIFEPGPGVLTATGINPQWYDQPAGGVLIGTGNQFTTAPLSQTTTFFVEDLNLFGAGSYTGGLPDHIGNSNFSGNQFNGALIFDCYKPFVLQTVKVYTDLAGLRQIELRDADQNVLQSVEVDIPVGTTVITLDFQVEPGTDLHLTTNAAFNNAQFGFEAPRLRRSNDGVVFPYPVGDAALIKNTNFGEDLYYYFFNWEIYVPGDPCTSDRVPATVVLQPNSVSEAFGGNQLSLVPNPASDLTALVFEKPLDEPVQATLFDLSGKAIWQQTLQAGARVFQLDVAELPAGYYSVRLSGNARTAAAKLIVE